MHCIFVQFYHVFLRDVQSKTAHGAAICAVPCAVVFIQFRAESDLRFNLDGPALGIRQLTPLDTGQGIVQLLGQGADLAAADVGLSLIHI